MGGRRKRRESRKNNVADAESRILARKRDTQSSTTSLTL